MMKLVLLLILLLETSVVFSETTTAEPPTTTWEGYGGEMATGSVGATSNSTVLSTDSDPGDFQSAAGGPTTSSGPVTEIMFEDNTVTGMAFTTDIMFENYTEAAPVKEGTANFLILYDYNI